MPVSPTVTLKLPRLVTANDYHEFADIQRLLRIVTDRKVHVYEVGFDVDYSEYVAVVYVGRKPSKRVIGQLAHIQKLSWDTGEGED